MNDVKYLLVAVDCMSQYLRVQPLKSKYATTTADAFKRTIKTKQPKKVWVDKGTEFKVPSKHYVKRKAYKHIAQRARKSPPSLREISAP